MKKVCWQMVLSLLGLGLISTSTQAEIRLNQQHCYMQADQWHIDAQLNISLPETIVSALKSGINLYFVLQTRQPSLHWWQPAQAPILHHWRLQYNHLNFAYLLQKDGQTARQFSDINSALQALGNLQQLPLSAPEQKQHNIQWRFYLQHEQLPAALRLNTLFSKQWVLDSDWWSCQM